jgi:dihydrofolate reductase
MRNVVLGFGMSLDGYIAQLDGGVDFLTMDKESEKLMKDFFATIDAIVMGRKTMEGSMRMTGGKYQPRHIWRPMFSRAPGGPVSGTDLRSSRNRLPG